jgi:hypothetical protein
MTKTNQMLYLSIHNIKDGLKNFKCGTRYDWYIIEKVKRYKNTIIRDEINYVNDIYIDNIDWMPNYNFRLFINITNNNKKLNILYSRSDYGSDKKWMGYNKDNIYKYDCILSTSKTGIRYMYSKHNNNGHFGIKKIIFGETGTYNCFYDNDGIYGLTNGCIGIIENNNVIVNNIINVLKSDKFNEFLKSCCWSIYRIDWNLFKFLNYDFWKEFI